MWLYLPWGFFSVIRYKNDPLITIRARRRSDLEALKAAYLPELGEIATDLKADYLHRAKVAPVSFATALARIVLSIDYSNVKGATAVVGGPERMAVYHAVHHDTTRLDDQRPGLASRSHLWSFGDDHSDDLHELPLLSERQRPAAEYIRYLTRLLNLVLVTSVVGLAGTFFAFADLAVYRRVGDSILHPWTDVILLIAGAGMVLVAAISAIYANRYFVVTYQRLRKSE